MTNNPSDLYETYSAHLILLVQRAGRGPHEDQFATARADRIGLGRNPSAGIQSLFHSGIYGRLRRHSTNGHTSSNHCIWLLIRRADAQTHARTHTHARARKAFATDLTNS